MHNIRKMEGPESVAVAMGNDNALQRPYARVVG